MHRKDPLDEIHIRGKTYSIKKIEKLYARDEAVALGKISLLEQGFECPVCNRFNDYKGDKPKFCKFCGQRFKWPRRKKK